MKGLIFTYAMTYGGAAISLVSPFHGLLIYISFAILRPPILWHWSVPAGNYSRIIGIAFLVGWAINGFGDRSLGKTKPIIVALLGYWLWVTLSTLMSSEPARGLPFVEYLAKVILPFIAGVTLIDDTKKLRQLIWVIVGSCAYLAVETNFAYLRGFNLEGFGFLRLDNNSFSILMVTGFGLAIILGFEDSVWWRRWLFFGSAAAMVHVPMMAMSRGGMVGGLIAALVAVCIVPKTRRTWWLIIVGVFVASVLAGPSVIEEFTTILAKSEERDASAQSRVELWRDCIDATLKHPIFGVGQECWPIVAESYGWNKGKEAHSLWFQTAAELGIPGVTFLLSFYVLVIIKCWKSRHIDTAPWMPTVANMMTVSIVAFAGSAAFVTVEGYELPYYVALIGTCGIKIAHASALEESHAEEEVWWPEQEMAHEVPNPPQSASRLFPI